MGAAPVNEDSSQRGKCMTRCSTPTPGSGLDVLAVLLVASGCGTGRGVAALREVGFQPDRVQGVRLAGIPLDGVRSPEDVSPDLLALVAAGPLAGTVPLEGQGVVRAP